MGWLLEMEDSELVRVVKIPIADEVVKTREEVSEEWVLEVRYSELDSGVKMADEVSWIVERVKVGEQGIS